MNQYSSHGMCIEVESSQKQRAGKWKAVRSDGLHCEKNTLYYFCPVNYHDLSFAVYLIFLSFESSLTFTKSIKSQRVFKVIHLQ